MLKAIRKHDGSVWSRRIIAAGMVAAAYTTAAQAAFIAPSTWVRTQANTTYQEWNSFTSAAGPNAADVGLYNPNGTPNAGDTSGTSMVTGGGNLYGFGGPLTMQIVVPDYAAGGALTTVILQIRSSGTEIDVPTLSIGGATPVDQAELSRVALGGFGGYDVENWYKFHLPYSAASFTVSFAALAAHMSLDRVCVDTFTGASYAAEPNPVPEPAALALMLAGGGLVVRRPRTHARFA